MHTVSIAKSWDLTLAEVVVAAPNVAAKVVETISLNAH